MKIKSFLLVLLALCLTVCLCACGDDVAPSDDSSKGDQGNKDSGSTTSSTTVTTTSTTAKVKVAKYTITVVDEGGNPIPQVMVQLCLTSCTPAMTNAEGIASFQMVEADYSIKFASIPEGYEDDKTEYHFDEGSYEKTLVLKAVA